jgi:hypothetical protein
VALYMRRQNLARMANGFKKSPTFFRPIYRKLYIG